MGLLWQVPRENWRRAGWVSEVHGGRGSLRVPWVRLPCRVFPSLADNTNRCFLAEKPLNLFGLKNPPLKNFSSYDIWMCRPLPRESRYCWQPVLWQGGELVLKSPRYHPLTNHRYHHRYQGELVLQSPENYHLLRTLELFLFSTLEKQLLFYHNHTNTALANNIGRSCFCDCDWVWSIWTVHLFVVVVSQKLSKINGSYCNTHEILSIMNLTF